MLQQRLDDAVRAASAEREEKRSLLRDLDDTRRDLERAEMRLSELRVSRQELARELLGLRAQVGAQMHTAANGGEKVRRARRAGHLSYFFNIKNDFLAFFLYIKLTTYFCTSPI